MVTAAELHLELQGPVLDAGAGDPGQSLRQQKLQALDGEHRVRAGGREPGVRGDGRQFLVHPAEGEQDAG